jgi:DNA modification methylase
MMLPGGRIGSRRISRKSTGVYGVVNGYTSVSDGLSHPCSILQFENDRQGNQSNRCYHPTQKPLKLLEWLVAAYTNEGDTILDPFAGSFTTALACLALSRRCIAIEKEEKYFSVGMERLKSMRHSNLFIGDIGEQNTQANILPKKEIENTIKMMHWPAV